jgi:hypothetical protein
LKIIIDCIAGTVISADFDQDDDSHQIALPNLSFSSFAENHQVINLLKRDIGHSHVSAWLQNIVNPVIQALDQNPIFLLVKNLYNQKIPHAKHPKTHKVFHVSFCHGVILLQLLNALSRSHANHHFWKVSHQSMLV